MSVPYIYKNCYEKTKSRKKLVEQFSVTGTLKSLSYFSFVAMHNMIFTIIL